MPRKYYAPDLMLCLAQKMRDKNDCGVWCLATYLSKPYEEVVAAVAQHDPAGGLNGMDTQHFIAAARTLGQVLEVRGQFDLDEDTGILFVRFVKGGAYHALVLKKGQVLDMRGTGISLWDVDVWLGAKRAKPISLLVLVGTCTRG